MRFNDSNREPTNSVATQIASLYRQNAEEQVSNLVFYRGARHPKMPYRLYTGINIHIGADFA